MKGAVARGRKSGIQLMQRGVVFVNVYRTSRCGAAGGKGLLSARARTGRCRRRSPRTATGSPLRAAAR